LRSSSFAQTRTSLDGDNRGRPTSGVPPTASTRLEYLVTAAQAPEPPATAGRMVT